MVLPTYQALKQQQGSHDSLSVSTESTMRRSGPNSVSNLNLSSLTLSDGNRSGSHLSSYNNNSSVNVQNSGLSRGWGSTETRRASTSLSSMAGTADSNYSAQQPRSKAENQVGEKDCWGYFVDVAEDEDEDVLMW